MDLNTLRQQYPELNGLDDESAVGALQQALYPDRSVADVAQALGVKVATPPAPPRTVGGTVADIGISALKGAIAIPEQATGLVDLMTGGAAGRGLEQAGVRFKDAKSFLDEQYSPAQQRAFAEVQQAEGVLPTLGAAVRNPSTIAHSVVESLPSMVASGMAGGAAMRAAGMGAKAGLYGGALGEGASMAGGAAEQIRQQTADGLLTPTQSLDALATGVVGGALAMVGGKVAQKLGIHDPDTLIAAGRANPAAERNIVRRVLEGAFAEGVLEELPQSIAEQVLQNHALGKPLDEGVDKAAVMGMLAGAAMGGGSQFFHGSPKKKDAKPGANPEPGSGFAPVDNSVRNPPELPPLTPNAGPLERAAAEAAPVMAQPANDGAQGLQDALAAVLEDARKPEPMFKLPDPADDARYDRDAAIYEDVMGATATGYEGDEPPVTADTVRKQQAVGEAAAAVADGTPGQQAAGNHAMGHTSEYAGLPVTIQRRAGQERSGEAPDGTRWTRKVEGAVGYGHVKRTIGGDGEQVDVWLGPRPDAPKVWVVDQLKRDGTFDEHKALLGFASRGAAINAYRANYPKDFTLGRITEMSTDDFKAWLKDGDLTKPAHPDGVLQPKENSNGSKADQAPTQGGTADLFSADAAQLPATGAAGPGRGQRGAAAVASGAAPVEDAAGAAAPAPASAGAQRPPGAAQRPSAAPAARSAASPAPERGEPAVGPRVVRLGDERIEVTPEQHARWVAADEEAQAERAAAQARFRVDKGAASTDPDVGLRGPKQQLDAEMKRIGMELSAKRRQILGRQTPKEQQATQRAEQALRAGERVTVDGKPGTVVSTPFGRVRVRLDGADTISTVPRDQVTKGAQEQKRETEPAPSETKDAGSETLAGRWNDMNLAERMALLDKTAGRQSVKERTAQLAWDELSDGWKRSLARVAGDKRAAAPATAPKPPRAAAEPKPPAPPPEPKKPKADALRAAGQKLVQKGEEDQGRERLSNTARRARMAASATEGARAMEAMGRTMVNLADAIEAGSAPALAGITTKAQVETLESLLRRAMYRNDNELSSVERERQKGREPTSRDIEKAQLPAASWASASADRNKLREKIKGLKGNKRATELTAPNAGPPTMELLNELKKLGVSDYDIRYGFGWYNMDAVAEAGRLARAGITDNDKLHAALRQYIEVRAGRRAEDPVKKLERELVGQKVGIDFFPTPAAEAENMAEEAGIKPGMDVLDPSAGSGNLADAARAAGANVEVVEVSDKLRELLQAKGYSIVGRDFMDFEPGKQYDAILMNPPFSNRQDAEHIQRAYTMLKPGGRLVAIAGEGVFNGSDKKAQAFRAWLEQHDAIEEKLPPGTFQDTKLLATTGANARRIVIEKPADEKPAFSQSLRTVQVGGERRPIENSRGQPIAPAHDFAKLRNFWTWFAGSKVVDAQDRPLVVFHGTPDADIDQFDTTRGAFFTSKAEHAGAYTYKRGVWLSAGKSPGIYPVYLAMKNPLIIDALGKRHDNIPVPWKEWKPKVFGNLPDGAVSVQEALAWAREHGHDGLIVRNVVDTVSPTDKTKADVYAVVAPEQVKSATGNRGTYDGANPDITFRQGNAQLAPEQRAHIGRIQQFAEDFAQHWRAAPEIVAVASVQSDAVPREVRDEAKKLVDNGGVPPGAVVYGGRIYLFADTIGSERDVAVRLLHEIKGHIGLRGHFGPGLDKVLRLVAHSRPDLVNAMIRKNGFARTERLRAAEEVLAEWAEREPKATLVQRAMAAVKQFLRSTFPRVFGRLRLTDSDIVASVLAPAARYAETAAGRGDGAMAFAGGKQPFYSALEREVGKLPDKPLSAIGWTGALNSLLNKGAVKRDEVEWSGVKEWLATREGRIGRDEVLAFLNDNGVQVQEVVKGGKDAGNSLDSLYVRADALGFTFDRDAFEDGDEYTGRTVQFTRRDPYGGDDIIYTYERGRGEQGDRLVADGNVEAGDRVIKKGAILEVARAIDGIAAQEQDGDDEDGTRYSEFTLPGGENYREILLTLPENPATKARREELRAAHRRTEAATPESAAVLQQLQQLDNNSYSSDHWNESNILAHIRVNDRTDADGKRVLFVEEVQSDWAQEGRRAGMKPSPQEEAEIKAEYEEAFAAQQAAKEKGPGAELDAAQERLNDAMATYNERINDATVPRAPFVEKTDAWVQLALKRIVKLAADEGYDRVAFVTGKQSADRYSLSKHIAHLAYFDAASGGVGNADLKASESGGTLEARNDRGEVVIDRYVQADQLADYVGKEVAEKLLASQPYQTRRSGIGLRARALNGLDLEVGGEGMKSFYDKIVPAALGKLLPKLGGEKVSAQRMDFGLPMAPGEANAAMAKLRGDTSAQVLGFDITPQMRAAVADGVPMFSQSQGVNDPRDWWKTAMEGIGEYARTPGKLNWWHKTLGTPFNLAQRDAQYKVVFDRVQDFLRDVSQYATEAADMAPALLPKLDSFRDLLPGNKKPLSVEDNKMAGRAVWEGTLIWTRDAKGRPVKVESVEAAAARLPAEEKARELFRAGHISENVLKMWQGLPQEQFEKTVETSYERRMLRAGIVWTDAELRSMFGLSDTQMGIYRQFRDAVDKSLTDLGLSDLVRYAGKDGQAVRNQVLNAPDIVKASDILRDHLMALATEAETAEPARASVLMDMANTVIDKAERIEQLKREGYAPLSRFGRYTVDVTSAAGERLYFGMYESRIDARRAAAKLARDFPEATVRRGTTFDEEHKLFRGMTPETAELFGEMLGLEADGEGAANAAFQKYLKETRAQRSALKRLIERKGIAGYSEDMGRVLAGFLYSNSRQTAQNLHTRGIMDAVQNVGYDEDGNRVNGELNSAAVRLMNYVRDPQEEAPELRGLLFAQYLGGSVASMLVNMTQPFQVTTPYLSQFGGIRAAVGAMKGAVADVWKKDLGDKELEAALQRRVEDGTVAPQEVHQLMAQAAGRGSLRAGDGTAAGNAIAQARNGLARLTVAWGKPFAVAELFNRRVTYIAAYRLAKQQGMADPDAFAVQAVTETQFVYNKGNKPEWARGAVGGLLFTFKQYSISYLELLQRMYQSGPEGKKAALFMVAMLLLMGGAGGLPFMEDAEDVADAIGQRMGYNLRTRHARERFLKSVLGDWLGGFAERGVSGVPGVPIDVAGRFGMGNLIPGTGLLPMKTDHTRDVTELAGPGGEFVTRVFQGANQLAGGNVMQAGLSVAPRAAANLAKAAEMATLGYYTDQRGRKVVDVGAADIAAKAIGFQPNAVAQVQQATRDVQQLVAVTKMKETEIADRWAQAVFKGDSAGAQSARDEVAAWDRDNPESPIRIQASQIRQRVRSMRMGKEERVAATAPREIRRAVRQELAEAKQQ